MNSQDSLQLDQPTSTVPAPLLQLSSFPPTFSPPEEQGTQPESQHCPLKEDAQPIATNDDRKSARNQNGKDKENQADQEQEELEEEVSNQNGDKIGDYVAKVLEKLVKQRNKMARLNSILEKKGLLAEKKVSEVENMAQQFEEIINSPDNNNATNTGDEEVCEDNTKENLSPTKSNDESVNSEESSATPQKSLGKISLEEALQISRRSIPFGTCFPGQIIEESFEIVNTSDQDFVVQIIVSCLNEELQNTEEYVYSVRRSHLYDYNDKHYLIMAPFSCAEFKFAFKAPNLKYNGKIFGQAEISIQGLNEALTVDFTTNVVVPKVFCPKELTCKGLDYKVIKLAVKEGKKQELKIPFRNESNVPVTLELEFYEPVEHQEEALRPLFDCLIHPNVITIPPNSNALSCLILKPSKSGSSKKGLEKPKSERKILTGRVRDSALVYSFVFWIETY